LQACFAFSSASGVSPEAFLEMGLPPSAQPSPRRGTCPRWDERLAHPCALSLRSAPAPDYRCTQQWTARPLSCQRGAAFLPAVSWKQPWI